MSLTHSFELPEVKEATAQLISDNAEHLSNYIYKHTKEAPYNSPIVRVGLVLKTMLKIADNVNPVKSETIEPAINDLMQLISTSKDASLTEVYQEELRFLKSCIILDDMITLNTVKS